MKIESTLGTMLIAAMVGGIALTVYSAIEKQGTSDSTPFLTGAIVGATVQLVVRMTGVS